MKGNGSDIAWNVREKPRDVVWIETGIAIVWIGNVEDRAIVSEGAGADRANVDAGEVAIDCRILISKRLNAHATEGIVIAIAIGIVKGGGREATIAIATGIVSGTSETESVTVGTERIVAIVRTRIRKRSVLRKNRWTIIQTTAIHLRRRARTSPQSSTKTIMIKKWRRNTGFRRIVLTRLRITITIPYKIIDLDQYMYLFYRIPFFTICHYRLILSLYCLLLLAQYWRISSFRGESS